MNNKRYTLFLYIGLLIMASVNAQKVNQPKYELKLREIVKDTVCVNMQTINSSKDDYLPFVVGKNLLFTSNRKSTQEGQTEEFTEKVYWTTMKNKNVWTLPRKNGYKWNS